MAEITLAADIGRPTGSRSSRRLRAQGKIPAVVYGTGADPVPVAVDWHDLRAALTTDAGLNALIDLEFGGDSRLSIVKELQRDPVRQSVTHVDFLLIRRDVAITVDVPVVLTGEADQVAAEDGIIDHVLFTLAVSAKPADIPNELTIDISGMSIGDTLRVEDLSLPAGVTTDVDPDELVASAQISRATIEAEAIEEADAELASEQAEGEEGAPAAEGAEATAGEGEAVEAEGEPGGGGGEAS